MTTYQATFKVALSFLTFLLASSIVYAVPLAISAKEAYQKAEKGEIVLVDIREPQEWKATGVSSKAKLIAMRDPKLLQKLKLIKLGSKKPIAVICAHGNRSRYLQKALVPHGFPKIIDVLKGMESRGGWIKSALPVKKWTNK